MNQLIQTLNWCVQNDVLFRVTINNGVLHIEAFRANVSSEWPIRAGTIESVSDALYASLFSVKEGTEFHRAHGEMPSLRACRPGSASDEGAGRGAVSPDSESSTPNLSTGFDA